MIRQITRSELDAFHCHPRFDSAVRPLQNFAHLGIGHIRLFGQTDQFVDVSRSPRCVVRLLDKTFLVISIHALV